MMCRTVATVPAESSQLFEEAGIEFIGGPGEGPGVRLWRKS